MERAYGERVVVFDLDGTLIDSSKALLAAHDVAWRDAGRLRPPDGAILDLIGLPLIDTMKRLDPGCDAATLAASYADAYTTTSAAHEVLFPGMLELLERPFRAAVATGKSQRGADRAVAHHGLTARFEVVFGGDAVPRPKPNPDLLHAIMRETDSTNLLMIGDTTYDLEMAHVAGVPAVGVSWGHHSVDRLEQWAPVVHTVDELTQFLFP